VAHTQAQRQTPAAQVTRNYATPAEYFRNTTAPTANVQNTAIPARAAVNYSNNRNAAGTVVNYNNTAGTALNNNNSVRSTTNSAYTQTGATRSNTFSLNNNAPRVAATTPQASVNHMQNMPALPVSAMSGSVDYTTPYVNTDNANKTGDVININDGPGDDVYIAKIRQ
jgi:hypothetical protein